MPSWLRTFRGRLAVVAGAGLAFRLLVVRVWSSGLVPEGDQLFYLRQAQYLARGFGFAYRNPMLPLGAPDEGYSELAPTAAHPPLYPAWLALVSLARLAGPDDHVPFRVATALLGAATVVVVGLAARRLAGPRAGLVAAVVAAVHPNLWVNDVTLFSESMYALTIALVLLAAAAYGGDRSVRNAAFLGGSVALAALTRAEALLLLGLLVVPLVLLAGGGRGRGRGSPGRDRGRHLAVVLGVAALVVGPWIARNAATFSRRPLTVSNGTGYVVEISNCDQTFGLAPLTGPDGRPREGAPADAMLGYWAIECDRTPWVPGDETETGAAKLRTGVDYVRAHLDRFPVVVAARVGRIWDVWRPGQSVELNAYLEGRSYVPALTGMVVYYPVAVAGLAGLVVLRRRGWSLAPYLALFVMTTLTAAVSFGITRYRVGAEVALVVLAGVAVDAAVSRWGRSRWGSPAADAPAAGSADTAAGLAGNGTGPAPAGPAPGDEPIAAVHP